MRSFRLDHRSIQTFIDRWPVLLVAAAISGWLLYAGWFHAIWRAPLIVFTALYFGYTLRGLLTSKLRAKYPKAAHLWLLSIGMTSVMLGVLARIAMPALQGGFADYSWLMISFSTIFAFVIINRRDPDVLK